MLRVFPNKLEPVCGCWVWDWEVEPNILAVAGAGAGAGAAGWVVFDPLLDRDAFRLELRAQQVGGDSDSDVEKYGGSDDGDCEGDGDGDSDGDARKIE